MSSLFSIFDPSSFFGAPLLWGLSLLLTGCFLLKPYWTEMLPWVLISQKSSVRNSLTGRSSNAINKSLFSLGWALLTFLILINFSGLLPYVFTPSRHLSFALGLSLPAWLGIFVYRFFKSPQSSLAHLVPIGTPVALIPFMVVIELISSVIRPLTLAVRLAANITAGHVLLSLISTGVSYSFRILVVLVIIRVLERMVALIQAYVFSSLTTLYLEEANTASMWN